MRKFFLFLVFLNLYLVLDAQESHVANTTPGQLATDASAYLNTVTDLTITGTIDKRDFTTIKNSMPALAKLDLSNVIITEYSGSPANTLPSYCFSALKGLTNVVFPSSLVAIGNNAFQTCTGLTGPLVIPNSVTSIGNYAFNDCSGLNGSLTLPPSLTYIGIWAFDGCTGLTGPLILPNTVTTIGDWAFYNCFNLTGSLIIPSSVTSIGTGAFNSCSGLTGALTIPYTVSTLGDRVFAQCSGLTSLDIEPGVTSIGELAFLNCIGLTGGLNIPSSVVTIGNSAFQSCSKLTTLTIPSSVTSIGNSAFNGCSGLTTITSLNTNPPTLGSAVFLGETTSKLIVPVAAETSYSGADQWKDFYSIGTPSPAVLSGFSTIIGTASSSKNFSITVSSSVLELTVAAPTNYEVRESGVGTFGSTVIFTSASGDIPTKTIEVRIASIAPAGTFSNNVLISVGSISQSLPVSGVVTLLPQSISFGALSNKTYGSPDFSGGATSATSGINSISYSSSDLSVATIVSGQIHIVGAGTTTITASQGGSSNYSAAADVSQSFTVDKKSLIISADNHSKVYDGLVFSPFSVSYSGFISGESEVNLTGSLTYSGSGTSAVNVGSGYVITPGGLSSGNYSISFVSGSLDITKSPQSISFGALSNKTYGSPDFSGGATSATSGINGISYSSSDLSVATIVSGQIHIVGAGTTTITASQGGSSNYSAAADVSQSFTVDKKSLIISADNHSKVYDGLVFSPFSVSYSGFISGESEVNLTGSLTYSGSGTSAINVGNGYVITPGGLSSGNYSISFVSGSLDITKSPQSISFGALSNKTYGSPDFSGGATSATSGINGISYSSSDLSVATIVSGQIHIVGAGTTTITASQGGSSNYSAASDVSQSFTVDKKSLIISADNHSKVYDGLVFSPFSVSYSGFISGESEVNLTGSLTYSGSGTSAINVGNGYVITPGGLSSGNYSISFVSGSLDITKSPQSISFGALSNKTYGSPDFSGGATSATSGINGISYSSSDLSVATIVSGQIHIVGAGTTTITASQGGSSNYSAASDVSQSFTVDKKSLIISADNHSKVYDGLVFSPFSVSYSGFISGESEVNLTGSLTYSGSGTSAVNVGSGYVITPGGLSSGNYSISFVSGSLDITKSPQSISFGALSNKTYGSPDFSGGATSATSGINGISYSSSDLSVATIVSGQIHIVGAGTTTITASQGGSSNYSAAADVSQSFTVDKKSLIISADNHSKVYDGLVFSPFSVSYSGFISGESEVNLTGSLTYSGSGTSAVNVGSGYVITPGGLSSGNYSISFVSGSLDITKSPQSISFGALSNKTYGSPDFSGGATSATSGINGISYSSSDLSVATIVSGQIHIVGAGTTTITASQGGSSNYSAASDVSQSFTVDKKSLIISADNHSKVYDGLVFSPFSVSYSGFISGESEVNLTGSLTYSGSGTSAINVGNGYVITPGGLSSGNYSISFVSGSLDITKSPQSISFGALSNKTYGSPDFSGGATSATSGINGISYSSSDLSVATIVSGQIHIVGAGTTTITASQGGSSNYSAASDVSQSFTVDKKSLIISADNHSKVYDGLVFSPFSVSYSGFISGESEVNLTGSLTYSGSGTSAINVGNGYVITPGGLSSGNYSISFVSGSLDITKSPQSISFGALSNKTYGSPDFSGGATSATSGINGISYSSSDLSVATIVSGQIHIVGAGTTTITASQGGSSNYSATADVSQSFTVDKKSLIISADNHSKVYDGLVFSPFSVSYSGFISGESEVNLTGSLTYSGSGTSAINVGNGYVITPGGLSSGNYSISFVSGSLDITKSPQSISFGALSNKTYGSPDFSGGATSATSGINSISYSSSDLSVATIVSGQIHIVGAGTTTITASQGGSSNYSAAADVSQSFTVDKKSLIISADNHSKVYDGLVFSPFSVSYSGFISGESEVNLTGSLTYSGSGTSAINVGNGYVITPGGLSSGNYSISFVSGSLDITKSPQSISFGALSNKTYGSPDFSGGATSATSGINGISYSSSDLSVATIVSGQIHIVGAGTTTITASQGGSSNYSAAADVSQSFTVDKKSLIISADNHSKVYDGLVFSPFSVSYSGFISGESEVNLTGSLTYSGSGTSAINVGNGYVITPGGLSSGNYSISFVSGSLDITKSPQSISFGALSNKTYGSPDFSGGATSATSGINSISYSSSDLSVATIVSGQIHIVGAGTTTITASQGGSSNYSAAADVSQSFTVDKKSLIISADNHSKVYDGLVFSPFSVSYSGFISGESEVNLTGSLTYSGSGTSAINVGNGYVITPGGLSSGNYSISFVSGSLDITKSPQSISFGALSNKTYGSPDFSGGATSATSGINSISYSSSDLSVATIVSGQIHIVGAGTTTITASQGGSSNYSAAADVSQSFTVDKKSLIISADNHSKVYDGLVFSPFSVSYSGFISGESEVNLTGSLTYSGSGTSAINVGNGYVITPGGLSSGNYSISFVSGSLDITKSPQSISFGALSNKTYGSPDFSGGATSATSGINSISYSSSDLSVATIVSGQIHIVGAGTTTITASQGGSSNYSAAADVSQSFTVDKKSLIISADNHSKVYDGLVFSPFSVSYSGFISGESEVNLTGSLTYSGSGTSAINVGNGYVITLGGLSSGNYSISFVSGSLDITKSPQSISFGALSNKTYGSPDFSGGATSATSGINGISYSSSDLSVATIVSGQIHIVGAGTTTITASQGGSSNYSAAADVSQSFTVDKKSLIISADNHSKVYDGLVFSPFSVSYSGFISGESEVNLTGSLTYSGSGTSAINVGNGYVITPGGLSSGNYSISFVSGSLDITKSPQSISFGALSNKTYGSPDFSGGATSATSGINSISYSSSDLSVATIVSGQIHIVGAGTTTITASQGGSSNYSAAADVSQSFTVDKKSLIISADNHSKVYDGLVFSPFSVSYSGFISGESEVNLTGSLTYSGSGTSAINVGNGYVITPGGLSSGNYSISFVSGSLDITKSPQSISFGALSNKTYGSPDFSGGATSATSGINSISYSSSDLSVATIVSGQIHIVGAGTTTITASQGGSSNYSAAADVSQSFTVDKKSLIISADNHSKVYDGLVFSPFSVSYSGFISGESEVNLTGSLTYSGSGTSAINVGNGYVITPGGLSSGNYSISFVSGSLDITKSPQSISFGALSNKTYGSPDFSGGATSATSGINGISYSSSDLSVATIVSGQIHIVGAGTTTITASQGGSSNYSAAADVSQSFTVDKKSLIISADNHSKVYDGLVFSPFSVSYSGFISGESEVNLTGSLTYSGSGTSAINVGNGYVITPGGLSSGNYSISFVSGSLDITKSPQSISFGALSNKTYGSPDFSGGATSATSGINSISYSSSDLSVATIVSGQIHIVGAGTTTITASQGGSSNYSAAADVSQSFTVDKKSLIISADNHSKVYDGLVFSPFSVSYSGFISGESEVNLTGSLTYSGSGTSAINVGNGYVITPGGLSSGNYSISFVSGSLDITKSPQSISFGALSNKTYGSPDFSGGATSATSGINSISYSSSDLSVATIVSGQIHIVGAGTTTITASQGGSSNYSAAADVSQSFTVDKKSLIISADNHSKVYDGLVFSPFSVSYSGFISGESEVNLTGSLTYSGSGTSAINVGNGYVITLGGLSSGNYSISFVSGSLDITKSPQSISFGALSNKTYGSPDFSGGATSATSGINSISYSSSDLSVATIVSGQIHIVGAGTTTITASQGGSSNYSAAADVSQSFTVDKKSLIITAVVALDKIYDATTTATLNGGTLIGIVGSDNVVLTGGVAEFEDKNVGTAKVVAVAGYALAGADKSNYVLLAQPNGITASIVPRNLIITADFKSKTYGDTDPEFTVQVIADSIQGSDTPKGTLSRSAGENIGVYTINRGTYSYGSNYNEVFITGSFTIIKREITVTIDKKEKTYGDIDPVFSARVTTGITLGTDVPSGLLKRVVGENVGSYAITQGTYTYGSNYSESFVSNNLMIGKRAITIVADAKSKTFGDTDPELTVRISAGVIQGTDTVIGYLKREEGEKIGVYDINQGTYTYGNNYAETFISGSFTINKRIITFSITDNLSGCENTDIELDYNILKGTPILYKLTFDTNANAVGIDNVAYTGLPSTSSSGVISFTIPKGVPYGVYTGTLQMQDQFGAESDSYTFQFTINISSDYIISKYDDVVALNNSSNLFATYQWYKNGLKIDGANEQFYNDLSGLSGVYYAEITTTDGKTYITCSKEFNISSKKKNVRVYPNVLSSNQVCTVYVSGFEEGELKGALLSVYTVRGTCVYKASKVETLNLLKMDVPQIYIGHLTLKNGKDYVFKIIVN